MRDQTPSKPIAFKADTFTEERLPFPIVLYPGHYGAFFAFKQNTDSAPHFCSCAYEAIENYIKIRKLAPTPQNTSEHRMYILDSFHFPLSVVEDLMAWGIDEKGVLNTLKFKEGLCHECNSQIPVYRYCHEMYGGVFKQNYGWYINKQAFEWGIDPLSLRYLPERCPDEILDEMKIEAPIDGAGTFEFFQGDDSESQQKIKELRKQNRKIRNIIENEVRAKFGHKKVGESWTSETILYYIVKKLFPNLTIHRHYRPDFLQGLELDIFIEEKRIGVEYQGIQHYKPIRHWGGEESLVRLKERDFRKKILCQKQNVQLVYFKYNDALSDDLIQQKLTEHGILVIRG